jgi:hypothetical protein
MGAFCMVSLITILSACSSDNSEMDDVLTRQERTEYVSRQTYFDIPFSDEVYVYSMHWEGIDGGWKYLDNEEKEKIATIPASYGKNVSTSALVLTWLDNPMMDIYHFYDHPFEKYQNMLKEEFGKNLYEEMLTRDDMGTCLLDLYKAFNKDADYMFINRLHGDLLYLFCISEFNSKMTLEEMKEFCSILIERKGAKDYVEPTFPLSCIMLSAGFPPALELFRNPEYSNFLEWGWGVCPSPDEFSKIINDFLNY